MTLAETLVVPHRRIVRADVIEAGVVVASSTAELKMTAGSVNAVRRAEVRRTASVTFNGDAAVPFNADDLLDPLARRDLQLWRGVRFTDGTEDLRSLGVVLIERAEVTEDGGNLTVAISGRDRAVRVMGNPWRTPYTIPTATNIGTAIQGIIEDRVGVGVFTFAFTPTTEVTTAAVTYDPSTNPWTAAQRLAAGIGMELFVDADGVCVMQPVPNAATDPVAWSFVTGQVLVGATSRTIDNSKPVNGVIVHAEAPWLTFPITGEAWDDDPLSPTRRERIGEYPETIRDATAFTQAAVDAAALAALRDRVGVEESVTWHSVPLPQLREGSVIEMESRVLEGTARAVVETLTMPLGADAPAQGTTRSRRAA